MEGARLAAWAELLHLKTIWIIATILLGDVIALFTLHTGHGDLGADIRALAGHRRTPLYSHRTSCCGRKATCPPAPYGNLVAEAGFEPATQRL